MNNQGYRTDRTLSRADLLRGQWWGIFPTAAVGMNDRCLAIGGVECRICEQACMAGAISFRPTVGRVAVPQIAAHRCNGCGDCLPVCPVKALAFTDRSKRKSA